MAFNPLHEPLRGAYCELEELTASRFSARQVRLPRLRRALALQHGAARAFARGRGLEFEEVRPYQPGDDIRTIDWRVTARSDRPFTRVFREERERPMLIAVDLRQPMFFGSQYCFKAKLGAWLGGALAWAVLAQGDRIGGLVFGNDSSHDVRPRRSRRAITAWLQTLHAFNRRLDATSRLDNAEASFRQALSNLERVARPGTSTALISDLSGADATELSERLQRLARHGDVMVIRITDPLERQLPPPARYTISDGQQRFTVDTGERALRNRFEESFSHRHDELAAALRKVGVPLLVADTAAPPLQALTTASRSRAGRQLA